MRVFLIDCPGVVYSGQEHDETELVLRGVCRVENITEPQIHIPEVLKRAKHEHLARLYQITGWEEDDSGMDFLERLARSRGKLLKGGEPDFDGVARTVLRDWQYGKIPYLTQPDENHESKEKKRLRKEKKSNQNSMLIKIWRQSRLKIWTKSKTMVKKSMARKIKMEAKPKKKKIRKKITPKKKEKHQYLSLK